jgi:hypothetical protein
MSETENTEIPNEINELEENPHVKSHGDVLKQKFTPLGVKPSGPSYRHPQETAILTAAKETLIKIPFGAHLLNFAANHSVPIMVIPGADLEVNTLKATDVVFSVPLKIPNDPEQLAFGLAIGIRQVEHKFLGWPGDGSIPVTDEQKSIFLSKNIDIVMAMCRIVNEFIEVNKESKLFDLLKRLGHNDIYDAYKEGESFFQIGERLKKKAEKFGT